MSSSSEPRLRIGDIVCHFKRYAQEPRSYEVSNKYMYRILNFAKNQKGRDVVVYEALYEPFQVWVRDYDEFMSEVPEYDNVKFPRAKSKYRFELYMRGI